MAKSCVKCSRELVSANGIHLGVPFAIWKSKTSHGERLVKSLICSKCYDEVSVNPDTKVQRTGEEVI